MGRISSAAVASILLPDSRLPESLYRQLYNKARDAILRGTFVPGQQMPSTRVLASDLGISRNTVLNAFEQLLAEGYLEGAAGSGTYVAHSLPEEMLRSTAVCSLEPACARPRRPWSRLGKDLTREKPSPVRTAAVPLPFQVGVPALEAFPFEIWNRILHRYLKKPSRELLFYGDPGGYMPLRRALASYLTVARAVRCTPEQIIVVSGAQQALDIAARLLLDPGDQAWIEEPGYAGAYWAIVAAGARPVPINVDQDGLNVQQGIARAPRARMIYITPSHQFPLGTTMTLTRRLELLRWAHKSGAWVLEDDYDNEFHYASHPIASLQGLDQSGNVIYLGTFSKIMFASLRLGYMVVAPDLVDGFLRAKAVTDRHCHTIEQAALAEFIIEGHLGRHIRRMRTLYLHRSQVLINAVEKYLGGRVELLRPDAGMHTVAWLPLETDDRKISQLAAADGLQILPLTSFYQKTQQRSGLILGFAGYGDHEIREGIQKLARVLAKVKTQ